MSKTHRAGLIVLGVLSVLDVLMPLLTDGSHPPLAVAVAAAILGLASVVLIVPAWRGARRAAVGLIALRALSALAAVPAVAVPDVPSPVILLAGTWMLLTVVGIALVLVPHRTAGAR